jgi:hypothetical protein
MEKMVALFNVLGIRLEFFLKERNYDYLDIVDPNALCQSAI